MSKKTPQQYIDESPVWLDGTETGSSPMTSMQWRIWALATAGKFFEGMVVFMGGIALPLVNKEFGLTPTEKGLVTASGLFGILIGASLLGSLSDKYGRKRMFIIELVLFSIFLTMAALAVNFTMLLIGLIGMGISLGCDYPTAHIVVSESIPTKMRGRLVLGAFGFQSLGIIAGSVIGYLVLINNTHNIEAWRTMYAIGIIPAILVFIARFTIPKSPSHLVSVGKVGEAEREIKKLLKRTPQYPSAFALKDPYEEHKAQGKKIDSSYAALFSKKHIRATALSSIPWFLQDLGTYGIGIFTPIILAQTIGKKASGNTVTSIIADDIIGAKGTIFVDIFIVFGVLVAILLAEKAGRIKLQVVGFIGAALGLLFSLLSIKSDGGYETTLLFMGFIVFNFLNNMGPNAQTYLIAGEVFPTHLRGKGAGLAASFSKIGAVVTAFLFPVLLKDWGVKPILIMLIITSLAGALFTWLLRIETRKSLEDL